MLQSEAVILQKKYQPALRNGIKIAVDLVNQIEQDKKDGDVDVRVKIAPNTVELINEFGFKETGPNEEAEEMAVMVFNEVIDSNVESYWPSDRYKAILKQK